MKLLLIAALAILASAHAEEQAQAVHDFMYFPDGNGVPHLIDLNEKYEDSTSSLLRNVNTIKFNLYTQNNPTTAQVLVLNSASSVTNSNFKSSRPTRFITHGWRSSGSSDSCILVRDAYLAVGDYNVIIVDWEEIASALYVSASSKVTDVGGRISQFFDFMKNSAGLDFSTTIIIGHSLGGHIAGISAHGASGTLQGVVALDPALPGFNSAGAGSGLHSKDAANVHVIHTNGGTLGLMREAGTIDFFPNGGQSQPGCGIDIVGSCAHSRSYLYFAESIRNPTGFRADGTSSVYMGGRTLTTATGSYTLNTASSSPFALG